MTLNFYFSQLDYLFHFKELIIVINSDFIRLNKIKLILHMGKCKPILVQSIEICLNMFNLICSDIYTSVKNQVVNIKIWQTSYTWVVLELLRQYKYLIFKATNFSKNWHQNCRKLKKNVLGQNNIKKKILIRLRRCINKSMVHML